MKEFVVLLVCAIYITTYESNGLKLIDIPKEYIRRIDIRSRLYSRYNVKPFKPLRSYKYRFSRRQGSDLINDAKDNTLKEKIGFLIEQTINDAQKEIDTLQPLKMRFNDTAGFRIGYLMYMVKRSRDVMNELFTVAVGHKDDWKALDQLKIFELIVHTNVDTSNLLRQLLNIATRGAQGQPLDTVPGGPEPNFRSLNSLRMALL